MAREKKKETLTLEERLQAALVPDWEQPYKVPENWCWTYWGACGNFQAGSAFKKEYQGLTEYEIPFYKVGSLKYSNPDGILYDTSNTVNEEIRNKLKATLIPENSIIFAKIGEAIRLNRRSINPVACCIDNNLMSFCAKACLTKYVYFWSLGIDFYNYANATTVPAIRKSDLEKVAFPLAPYAEQQRIIDRIESLFANLDEAKQKVQDALDNFETRKAAILHKAFTGELTAQWRKEHGVGRGSWKKAPLKNVAQIGSGGTPSRKNLQYYSGNIPWVKTGEICWNCIYDSEEKITEEAVENSSARLYPAGTVLVAMYGQGLTRGRAAILGVNATTNQAVCALQPYDCMKKKYLYYYFMENYWEYREKAVGGNQPNYSATMIGNWIINIPSFPEQNEIVRILDDLLAKEQQAKEVSEAVLEQIDLIKKSILARAFCGELGTNDPAEESAVELVKEVVEKSAEINNKGKTKTKRTVIPRKIKSALSNSNEEEIVRLLIKSVPKAVSLQMIMSISKKKFELMDALRSLEQKQIVIKNSLGEYLLKR